MRDFDVEVVAAHEDAEQREINLVAQRHGHPVAGDVHARSVERRRAAVFVESARRGDEQEALRLDRELLTDMERVLGADHPDTFRTRNNIATATESVGDLREALRLYRELLPDRVEVLGAGSPQHAHDAHGNRALRREVRRRTRNASAVSRAVARL